MSDRQARALLSAWPLVVGATQAELDETKERLAEMQKALESVGVPR